MINCLNHTNSFEFGPLLYEQFKLRYKQFIERQDYDVCAYMGMEYDQYDTPAASYLVFEQDGAPLGVSRLTPTTQGCMLNDLWPHLVKDKSLLNDSLIWEGTRYCMEKDIDSIMRRQIINEMAIAYLEFGLDMKLDKIIGMMPTYIYRSVFERPGIEMEYLGDVYPVGRHKIRAVAIPVEEKQLENVRNKTGIFGRVLTYTAARDKPLSRETSLPYEMPQIYANNNSENIWASSTR